MNEFDTVYGNIQDLEIIMSTLSLIPSLTTDDVTRIKENITDQIVALKEGFYSPQNYSRVERITSDTAEQREALVALKRIFRANGAHLDNADDRKAVMEGQAVLSRSYRDMQDLLDQLNYTPINKHRPELWKQGSTKEERRATYEILSVFGHGDPVNYPEAKALERISEIIKITRSIERLTGINPWMVESFFGDNTGVKNFIADNYQAIAKKAELELGALIEGLDIDLTSVGPEDVMYYAVFGNRSAEQSINHAITREIIGDKVDEFERETVREYLSPDYHVETLPCIDLGVQYLSQMYGFNVISNNYNSENGIVVIELEQDGKAYSINLQLNSKYAPAAYVTTPYTSDKFEKSVLITLFGTGETGTMYLSSSIFHELGHAFHVLSNKSQFRVTDRFSNQMGEIHAFFSELLIPILINPTDIRQRDETFVRAWEYHVYRTAFLFSNLRFFDLLDNATTASELFDLPEEVLLEYKNIPAEVLNRLKENGYVFPSHSADSYRSSVAHTQFFAYGPNYIAYAGAMILVR